MTKLNYRFLHLIIGIFFLATSSTAQSVNLDETWKEFLDNNKISNMSALNKPNKYADPLDYIRYLLMNTNTSFCQSEVAEAEALIVEIRTIDPKAFDAIPGFEKKLKDLEAKIKAYHSMDGIWQQFLQTKEVDLKALESVKAAKTSCEKQTLAKYSYMTVYAHYCRGDVAKAKNILETRTLRLTEKTSLRVEDVEGLGEEVAKMKSLFQQITELDANWKDYVKTGVSPGYDNELPLFPCNPIPNMKEWVLKGAVDVCNSGAAMLEKIKTIQADSGVKPDGALAKKIKELEAALKQQDSELAVLNKAWNAFLRDGEVKREYRKYVYEYCENEPLIRAYLMDGFANICGVSDLELQDIESLRQSATSLEKITITKINELQAAYIQYQDDEVAINTYWNDFVAQGDQLSYDYRLADYYCDNIYDVKSWLIKGLSVDCKEAVQYLELIDEVKNKLEFEFTHDVKCRVEKLRFNIWDCQYQVLAKLARVQDNPDSFEVRMEKLMKEYGVGPKPELCTE